MWWNITLGFYASGRGRLCKKHPTPTNILNQKYSRLRGPLITSPKGISAIKPETGILRSLSSINKDFGNFGKSLNSRIFTLVIVNKFKLVIQGA